MKQTIFFWKYMASLFCRLKFKQRYYRISFSKWVKVRLSSLSGFQHTICKTFGIFSDYSLVIRAKGPARVKNAKGSAKGQERKRVRRWSKGQKGWARVKPSKKVKRTTGSTESQKGKRVRRGCLLAPSCRLPHHPAENAQGLPWASRYSLLLHQSTKFYWEP